MQKFTVIPMIANDCQFTRMSDARFDKNCAKLFPELAKKHVGSYNSLREQSVAAEDEIDAAERVFDLCNNPGKDYERSLLDWDKTRSLSIGDMVSVNGKLFLCLPIGWQPVEL
jgi:hypothetical protein